jgi:hypothetical protein
MPPGYRLEPVHARHEINLGGSGNGTDMPACVEGWITTVEQIGNVRSGDLPRLVEAYRRHRTGMRAGGAWETAPMAVSAEPDDLCGNLMRLTVRHPHEDALRRECTDAALIPWRRA